MLVVFKRTSDQTRLAAVKRRSMRRFSRSGCSTTTCGRSCGRKGEILRHNADVPAAVARADAVDDRSARARDCAAAVSLRVRGERSGESVLLKAQVAIRGRPARGCVHASRPRRGPSGPPSLDAPAGSSRDPGGLVSGDPRGGVEHRPEGGRRLRAAIACRQRDASARPSTSLTRSCGALRCGSTRLSQSAPLPRGGAAPGHRRVSAITVAYPERVIVFGWDLHWMIVYFALSMVFAFALRKRFGVVLLETFRCSVLASPCATLAACVVWSAVSGCSAPAPDQHRWRSASSNSCTPETVSGGAPDAARSLPRQEWRFDGEPPPDAEGLCRNAGVGRRRRHRPGSPSKTGISPGVRPSDFPILRIERTAELDSRDQLHAIEIRLRASAGANISIVTRGPGPVDHRQRAEARRPGRPGTSPRRSSPAARFRPTHSPVRRR